MPQGHIKGEIHKGCSFSYVSPTNGEKTEENVLWLMKFTAWIVEHDIQQITLTSKDDIPGDLMCTNMNMVCVLSLCHIQLKS